MFTRERTYAHTCTCYEYTGTLALEQWGRRTTTILSGQSVESLSRKAVPPLDATRAPYRLKGQSPSYLRFDQLPLSPSSFTFSSVLLSSFRSFSPSRGRAPRVGWRRSDDQTCSKRILPSTENRRKSRGQRFFDRSLNDDQRFFDRFVPGRASIFLEINYEDRVVRWRPKNVLT